MRKIISLTLLVTMALMLFTGCGKPAVATAAIRKDQEQLLQTAENGRESSALLIALEVPDRFTGEWTGVNGLVHVTADAEIELPNTDHIPTGSVMHREFEQADLDNLRAVFLKGQPYYEEISLTRQEAQTQLEKYQAMLRGDIPLEGDATQEKLPEVIAFYEEQVRIAPNEGDLLPASTTLVSDGYLEKMWGWSEVDGKEVHLWVTHVPNFWDKAVYYVKDYGDSNYAYAEPTAYFPEEVSRAPFHPDFSAEEAQQMGDALVKELGFENVVCDAVTPVWFADPIRLYGAEEAPLPENASPEDVASLYSENAAAFVVDTGYQLQYVRCLGGFPISYTSHRGDHVEHDADHSTVWVYEQIEVDVTKDGVVYFSWISPYTEPVMELEDTQLMSFEEITSVFGRMVMVNYSYIQTINDNGGNSRADLRVDKVKLGLMRIKAKDSAGKGLLVPVWDFWGVRTISDERGDSELAPEIVLTLNAIDGSMIDRDLGY